MVVRKRSFPANMQLTEQTKQMFFMVSYNIDKFREFVFNSSFLQRYEVDEATVEAIKDDEIALLRVKIKSVLEHDPENIKLIMRATNTLERLIRTKYNITKDQKKGLKEAISNVLRDVALPLGIGIGGTLNK